MIKSLVPKYSIKNIFELNIDTILEKGYTNLFLDLDNTLDSYKTLLPSDRVKKFINECKEKGITPYIVSNNNSDRVINYGKELDIEVFSSMKKPFKKRLNKLIKEKNIDKSKTLMIGDQIFTDVWGGNNLDIVTILVEPIVKEDQFVTKIKRPLEKIVKKKIKKKKLVKEWGNE